MWIQRKYQDLIAESVSTRPAVLVTGARQTGKTSILSHMFPDYSFVSLDLPSMAELAENEPERFLREFPPPVIIDEAQYAPRLFRHLKRFIDESRSINGQFLLTGSQKFQLMNSVGDSLAGRIDIIEFETLSQQEILSTQSSLSLESLLFRGGYPELHNNVELRESRFFSGYIASYLERDVKGVLNVQNLRDFESFIRALALRSGQLLNKAEVAKDIGISPTTANSWISVLEASGQITLLEPWFGNKTKQMVKSPKLYFNDTGLLIFLLGIRSEEAMLDSPYLGAIWETFVFSEIRKRDLHRDGSWNWNFYRDKTREIDFIKDEGGVFTLLECKWTESPSKKDIKHLEYFRENIAKGRVAKSFVVSRPSNRFPLSEFVDAANLQDLW
ncbi:ATP-binding protein [Pseudobacteriovorax antillogorgiicola]|uniref:AAA+ ATPase domain-containing protein n=1 Tax=Pseudobacteriovorax antillogorgiicola TaxID=1513793 RepID=A0A1Y6C1Z1_9BACT|nr:ATP-binding protein [Pseudobacteriovorax antillogorgiicola]TCS50764.1 hypothetical protein EDD56_112147 [Pseudobacteriovorax antillogorgiicola]SMF41223.1 hypothetical protein SAMN06296036_112146 [Pseudobacteriovorax antillogorgiicola]